MNTFSESMTEVVGGPDIHVDRQSTLQMTCRVTSGDKTPAFIIWQRDDKVRLYISGPLLLKFVTINSFRSLNLTGEKHQRFHT